MAPDHVRLCGPEPIVAHHDCSAFASGEPNLDEWLRRRALANQTGDATRTSVVHDDGRVIAYFALAATSVALAEAQGNFRRNMPAPVPAILLARLALDRSYQGKGWGAALYGDAARQTLAAADIIGARGLITHAVSDSAKGFYLAMGMAVSPLSAMTLMVTCAELRRNFGP
ncbi:MAG: GNAT family N-acetyltransferase [Sphingomonadaceae bacterium]